MNIVAAISEVCIETIHLRLLLTGKLVTESSSYKPKGPSLRPTLNVRVVLVMESTTV